MRMQICCLLHVGNNLSTTTQPVRVMATTRIIHVRLYCDSNVYILYFLRSIQLIWMLMPADGQLQYLMYHPPFVSSKIYI